MTFTKNGKIQDGSWEEGKFVKAKEVPKPPAPVVFVVEPKKVEIEI